MVQIVPKNSVVGAQCRGSSVAARRQGLSVGAYCRDCCTPTLFGAIRPNTSRPLHKRDLLVRQPVELIGKLVDLAIGGDEFHCGLRGSCGVRKSPPWLYLTWRFMEKHPGRCACHLQGVARDKCLVLPNGTPRYHYRQRGSLFISYFFFFCFS